LPNRFGLAKKRYAPRGDNLAVKLAGYHSRVVSYSDISSIFREI